MKFSKTNSSSFRYFLARFKPFGNFMFWGPLSILGLLSFAIWQYTTNPEWLTQVREELPTLEDSFAETQNNLPTNSEFNQPQNLENTNPLFQQSNNSNLVAPSPFLQNQNRSNPQSVTNLNQPNSNKTNSNQPQNSSLIEPVLSGVKSQPSLFQSSSIQPIKPTPILSENHLEQAIKNKSQRPSNLTNSNVNSRTSSQTLPNLNTNNSSSFSNPSSSSSQPLPNNTYSTQPGQSSIHPYQVPYNNYSTQPQPIQSQQSQPIQPPATAFQVPYNNYPTQSPTNNFSGQSNSTQQRTTFP